MKHENEFREFLAASYSKKVVSDVVSRCKRVERELCITLPTSEVTLSELRETVKKNGDKFGEWQYAYNQYTHSISTYGKFIAVHRKPGRLG